MTRLKYNNNDCKFINHLRKEIVKILISYFDSHEKVSKTHKKDNIIKIKDFMQLYHN
jgi:septum formation topological specificity factor MinE